jgi:hypothetical protein
VYGTMERENKHEGRLYTPRTSGAAAAGEPGHAHRPGPKTGLLPVEMVSF